MENSLEKFVSKYYDISGLTKAQRKDIQILLIRYIFRFCNAQKFTSQFHKIVDDKPRLIEMRRDVLIDGYIMTNIKLWIYYVAANDLFRKQREETAKKFNIKKEDISILSLKSSLEKEINNLVRGKYRALTLARLHTNIASSMERLKTKTSKFVYRKMRFIIQSQGLEPEDLIQQVMMLGIQEVYKHYPKIKSTEHCDNIMFKTIHDRGQNLIEFYSGKKRSKFEQLEDGTFTNKAVPISYAVTDDAFTDNLSTSIDNSKVDFIDSLTVRKLLEKYTDRRQKFLKLLMERDTGFSKYLQDKKITRLMNDEFMDRCSTDMKVYISHVLNYLGVKQEVGEKFISTLRKELREYA